MLLPQIMQLHELTILIDLNTRVSKKIVFNKYSNEYVLSVDSSSAFYFCIAPTKGTYFVLNSSLNIFPSIDI